VDGTPVHAFVYSCFVDAGVGRQETEAVLVDIRRAPSQGLITVTEVDLYE
jgi:hypothetical protein